MTVYCYCEKGHLVARLPPSGPRGMSLQRWKHGSFGTVLDEEPAHCFECGAPTMTACKHCSAAIQQAAKYCTKCGKALPWTEYALAAARDYTDEIEDLSDEDKTALKGTFQDLTIETARTPVAANKFMKLLQKAAPGVIGTLRGILVDVMAETAVKLTTGR